MIEDLIERMFHARNAAHIAHWKTKSYAEHKALGHYYEDVIEKLDDLIETAINLKNVIFKQKKGN